MRKGDQTEKGTIVSLLHFVWHSCKAGEVRQYFPIIIINDKL